MTGTPFFRLTGAFLVGVASLLAALLVLALFFPLLMAFFAVVFPFLVGAVLLVTVIVILWVLIYFFTMIGVGVYYAIRKPAIVNEKPAAPYEVSAVSEAGKREKGSSARIHKKKNAAARKEKKPAKGKARRKK